LEYSTIPVQLSLTISEIEYSELGIKPWRTIYWLPTIIMKKILSHLEIIIF
jgi:hypothetical protein